MISVEQTTNLDDLGLILHNSEIFNRIAEDGVRKASFNKYSVYLLVRKDDKPIGVFILNSLSSISAQIHYALVEKYRGYGVIGMRKVYEWCLFNLPSLNKMVAEVATKYDDVYRFCKLVGFSDEGLNRQAFLKDGKIWDQHRVGITRNEIIEFLGD